MSRLSKAFHNKKALVVYVTAGDPTLAATETLLPALEAAGADVIEVGVPFSDPTADGPTIQRASERALASGTTLSKVLELVRAVRSRVSVPIVLFSYYNPIFSMGIDRFVAVAKAVGIDGVLVVDLPPEEAGELDVPCRAAGVDRIYLIAPNTPPGRVRLIAKRASGFIYFVSLTGVTGAPLTDFKTVAEGVSHVRRETDLPIAVGFGVATPDDAFRVAAIADGVVVGSAVVKAAAAGRAAELVRALRSAIG